MKSKENVTHVLTKKQDNLQNQLFNMQYLALNLKKGRKCDPSSREETVIRPKFRDSQDTGIIREL